MSDINKLEQWYNLSEQLAQMKKQELALRKELVAEFFPELKEGTNKIDIPGDAELVATLPYNYSVDADSLEEALKHVPKTKRDKLVTWKPSLSLSAYRSLSKKAMTDFTTECLTVKPGSPSLKIVAAK